MVSSRVQEYSESKIELFCGFFIVFNVEKKFKDIISSFNPKKTDQIFRRISLKPTKLFVTRSLLLHPGRVFFSLLLIVLFTPSADLKRKWHHDLLWYSNLWQRFSSLPSRRSPCTSMRMEDDGELRKNTLVDI